MDRQKIKRIKGIGTSQDGTEKAFKEMEQIIFTYLQSNGIYLKDIKMTDLRAKERENIFQMSLAVWKTLDNLLNPS